jgi:hypothetical protein
MGVGGIGLSIMCHYHTKTDIASVLWLGIVFGDTAELDGLPKHKHTPFYHYCKISRVRKTFVLSPSTEEFKGK